MLTSLEFTIKKDEKTNVNPHYGSLMHGVLMQKINSEYAEKLHANSLKPYSQYIYYDWEKSVYIWKINTITQEAKENIIIPLMNNIGENIIIENKKLELAVSNRALSGSISYKELSEEFFIKKPTQKRRVIKFLTPTSFKTNGDYTIFAEIHNIYSSLYKKWNGFASEISLEDKDFLDHIIKYTKIIGYNLKSTKYGMEGIRINSFQGEICLNIAGPDSLIRLSGLLFAFGEYSGIGAKTALGMGGIRVE